MAETGLRRLVARDPTAQGVFAVSPVRSRSAQSHAHREPCSRQSGQAVQSCRRASGSHRLMIFTPCSLFYDPGVVPIFFAIDSMLALVGLMISTL